MMLVGNTNSFGAWSPTSLTVAVSSLTSSFENRVSWQASKESVDRPRLPGDKWLLSSALQKSIRFGMTDLAVEIALALHHISPSYLPRRLPTIAMEDVGVANIELCFDVLQGCGSSRFAGDRSCRHQEGVLINLVSRLAASVKSRAACDWLCLVERHADAPGFLLQLEAEGASSWESTAATACDPIRRGTALRLLGGITIRAGGRFVTVSRASSDSLIRASAASGVPEAVQWLVARSRRTDHIATMLPMVWEDVRGPDPIEVVVDRPMPGSAELIAGLPAAAFDRHCELGRRAIALFFARSYRLRGFVARHAKTAAGLGLLQMAIFYAESAKCSRVLRSAGLKTLIDQTARQEMRFRGLSNMDLNQELFDLIAQEFENLLEARRQIARENLGALA